MRCFIENGKSFTQSIKYKTPVRSMFEKKLQTYKSRKTQKLVILLPNMMNAECKIDLKSFYVTVKFKAGNGIFSFTKDESIITHGIKQTLLKLRRILCMI